MREQESLDGVLPFAGLGQQEQRAATNHDRPMADEFREHILERQHPRFAVHERQEIERK